MGTGMKGGPGKAATANSMVFRRNVPGEATLREGAVNIYKVELCTPCVVQGVTEYRDVVQCCNSVVILAALSKCGKLLGGAAISAGGVVSRSGARKWKEPKAAKCGESA